MIEIIDGEIVQVSDQEQLDREAAIQASTPPVYDPLTEELIAEGEISVGTILIAKWTVKKRPANIAAIRVRAERNRLLSACDWVAIRARELGQTVPAPWYTYRSALRQLPEQEGFPFGVIWPEPPE